MDSGTHHHYIKNWHEYFIAIANTVAQKSKDPRCQVGAIIVSPERLILSTGFNGFARGVYDDEGLLGEVDEKLKWICHAEVNAILNAAKLGIALKGSIIYVTKFPCFACCNNIVQAGIKKIYTLDDRYWDDDPADDDRHSRKKALINQAKVDVEAPFHPDFCLSGQHEIMKIMNRDEEQISPGVS